MRLLGLDWKYISEGNFHIVLQLVGTSDVIRLIKAGDEILDKDNIRGYVDFVNVVSVALLSLAESYREEVVEIPLKQIKDLSNALIAVRPKNRTFKSSLSTFAIKAPNLAILSPNFETNYCIEIKPKEGYLRTAFKKYGKCYYCMKQNQKLQKKEIQCKSSFCPVDLFSGDRNRMRYAVKSLIDNPQNNLKIFKNNSIVYDENSERDVFDKFIKSIEIFNIEEFIDFIIEILLSDAKSDLTLHQSVGKSQDIDTFGCNESNVLDENSFLYNLLDLQKIKEEYITEELTKDDNEYISEIIDIVRNDNIDLNTPKHRKEFLNTLNTTHRLLLSAVFRDCSVMIAFASHYEGDFPSVKVGKSKIPYRVGVTDLEPKSAHSLLKRKESEDKLIKIYEKNLAKSVAKDVTCIVQMTIQVHSETRAKQLEAWEHLIADYMKANKLSTIDIRETQNSPLFNNAAINRKLSQEAILTILEEMSKSGKAAPTDKSKNIWEVYWHSLDEWASIVHSWAMANGMTNSVCTLFELVEGENTAGEEFHGLDMNVLVKALKTLELKGKCELMSFDDSQGVKFF